MTEDEAKAKACPVEGYRGGTHDADGFCIGSACMAFRWQPDWRFLISGDRSVVIDRIDSDVAGWGYWWSGRYAKNDAGYLHREIASRIWGVIPKSMFVDHRDGDTLNNRRGNLRLVTPAQNAANSAARGGRSRHRGVFMTKSGKWAAQIAKSGVHLHLGTFADEDSAAAAYDAAARDVHGEYARLNEGPRPNSGRHGYCGLAGRP
jgi:hypothetical protein